MTALEFLTAWLEVSALATAFVAVKFWDRS
jgi:hypothetical protein